jgi:penicillin V acylase-like amidase (Ntn superfamily)
LEESDDSTSNATSMQHIGAVEFVEWLLMNFSIWAEATAYFNATKFLEMACKFCGIGIAFHGELGKRTKFQQKSLPQLVVKVIKF